MLQFHLLKFVYQGRKKRQDGRKECLFKCLPFQLSCFYYCVWLGNNSRVQLGQQIFLELSFSVAHNFLTNKELPSDDFHYSASKQSTLEPNINTAGDCFSILPPCLTWAIAVNCSACLSLDKVSCCTTPTKLQGAHIFPSIQHFLSPPRCPLTADRGMGQGVPVTPLAAITEQLQIQTFDLPKAISSAQRDPKLLAPSCTGSAKSSKGNMIWSCPIIFDRGNHLDLNFSSCDKEEFLL